VEFFYFKSGPADNRYDIFERIFYDILLKDELDVDVRKLAKIDSKDIKSEKFEFVRRLINFSQILEDDHSKKFSYDVLVQCKDFFSYCFVEENCPKSMWLWTLNLFRVKHLGNIKYFKYFNSEKIENFREIKYEDYKFAFGNHSSNQVRISKKVFN